MSKMYLTDSLVKSLALGGGRGEVWDTVVPGLGLRHSTRKKTWFYVYHSPEQLDARGNRRRRRLTLGAYPTKTLVQARAEAAALREKVQIGQDPAAPRGPAVPKGGRFQELARSYFEEVSKPELVRCDLDQWALEKVLIPAFGSRPVASLTPREIEAYLRSQRARGPYAVRFLLKVLRKVLQWGVVQWELPGNPARLFSMAPPPPRDRVLTAQEVGQIWQVCEARSCYGSALLRLRLATAQRGRQIWNMNEAHLEETADGVWWNVPSLSTKTKRPNRIYLSPLAREVIQQLTPGPGGWVFGRPLAPRERACMSPELRNAAWRATGARDWKAMDLRRTAATWLARAGVSRFIVKRVLGHADNDITAVYDLYSYEKEVRAAVLLLEQAILDAIGRTSASA